MNARLLLAATLAALSPLSLSAQKVGDAVTTDALGKLDWLTGAAPENWEPGKVYVLECWATWCGPCIAAIPHVDALYDKYREKGLRVYGINVMEDGREKVADFVTKKGDGMSYSVAYTGKGGAFETAWLKPAEVKGIPSAFVVKDGKVLLQMHPAGITDDLVEALLEGGEAEKAAIVAVHKKDQQAAAGEKAVVELVQALKDGDKATIMAKLEAYENADPSSEIIPQMRIYAYIACGSWDEARKEFASLEDDREREGIAYNLMMFPKGEGEMPKDLLEPVVDAFEHAALRTPGNFAIIKLAIARERLGQREQAISTARKAGEVAEAGSQGSCFPKAVCEQVIAAFEKGEVPNDENLWQWYEEATE